MKKLSIICTFCLFLCFIVFPLHTTQYCKDSSEKERAEDPNKEAEVDIWLRNMHEPLITAGFWITHDPSKVSITGSEIYDNSDLPGPWDHSMTSKVINPDGQGTYMVIVGNLSNVEPDKNSEIMVAKVRLLCKGKCTAPIKVSTIPGFDTVVGDSGHVYDPEIKLVTFISH